jgi:hypothetical protein
MTLAFECEKRTDVGPFNCGLGSPESQPDVLVPSPSALSSTLGLGLYFVADEDVWLFLADVRTPRCTRIGAAYLESALALDSKLGRHDRGYRNLGRTVGGVGLRASKLTSSALCKNKSAGPIWSGHRASGKYFIRAWNRLGGDTSRYLVSGYPSIGRYFLRYPDTYPIPIQYHAVFYATTSHPTHQFRYCLLTQNFTKEIENRFLLRTI